MLSGSHGSAALDAAPGRWAGVCLLLCSVLLLLGLARPALAQTPMCSATDTAITGTAAVTSDMTIDTTGLVADCTTLLGLKNTLIGTATLSPDWAENVAMDTWDGVTVDGTPPRVTELNFHRKGLTGTIPPALGSLSNLKGLELHHSDLTGPIPEALGALSNLETLNLHVNQLTGPIPEALGSLSNLKELGLDQNQLDGTIPPELGQLTKLETLTLNRNQLTGMIPEALGSLSNLTDLWLHENQLDGPIPAAWGSANPPPLRAAILTPRQQPTQRQLRPHPRRHAGPQKPDQFTAR